MAGIILLFSATDNTSSSLFLQIRDYESFCKFSIFYQMPGSGRKRLLEVSSVAENNRIIPAIDKLNN